MAAPSNDIATGITLTAGTSGWSAEIVDINGPSLSRDAIDVTHQGSTNALDFSPADLYDPGELSLTVHFKPNALPPIDQANETWTIAWPAGDTWAASGHMTGFSIGAPLNDKMTADVTIKFSGDVTVVAS